MLTVMLSTNCNIVKSKTIRTRFKKRENMKLSEFNIKITGYLMI